MTSPQTENGYIKIANELVDELCKIRIPGEAMQLFLFIMRKTYGWKKDADVISNSQFARGTGMPKQNIKRNIDRLIAMNLVIKSDYKKSYKYTIVRDSSQWRKVSKVITVIRSDYQSNQKRLQKVINNATTKETTKETITKERAEWMVINKIMKGLNQLKPSEFKDKNGKHQTGYVINKRKQIEDLYRRDGLTGLKEWFDLYYNLEIDENYEMKNKNGIPEKAVPEMNGEEYLKLRAKQIREKEESSRGGV